MDFQHEPLDRYKQQIRLLKIDFEDKSDGLACVLEHFDLDEACPPYRALSYTWADSPPDRRIEPYKTHGYPEHDSLLINGEPFEITRNLHDFFKSANLHSECPDYLFVDQICINQKDVLERNHQVQLMKRIYRDALEVLTWLDETREDVSLAVTILEGLQAAIEAKTASPEGPVGADEIIANFLRQPSGGYFSRVWVMQEIVLAKAILVLSLTLRIPWSVIEALHVNNTNWSATPAIHFVVTRRLFNWERLEKGISFASILTSSAGTDCSDFHDHVYGCLGIARTPLLPMPIDYSKSRYELFIDTVECLFMDFDQGMDIVAVYRAACKLGFWSSVKTLDRAEASLKYNPCPRERSDIMRWVCSLTEHCALAPNCTPGVCSLGDTNAEVTGEERQARLSGHTKHESMSWGRHW